MENFKVDSSEVFSKMQIAKSVPIVTPEDIQAHYHFDDNGNAYKLCPLAVYEKRKRQSLVKSTIDESTTPCYLLFSCEGHSPAKVTKSGVETRDKSVWFLTEKEALDAKAEKLSAKRENLEKKLKKAEKDSKKSEEVQE